MNHSDPDERRVPDAAEVAAHVRVFLAAELELGVDAIHDAASLEADLNADSLTLLALLEDLQEEYDLTVDTRHVAKVARATRIDTVGDLIAAIVQFLHATAERDQEADVGANGRSDGTDGA